MHDTDVFAIGADQADFGCTDLSVYAGAVVARRGRIMWSAGYRFVPLVVANN
ncbi:hypothetical protein [Chachezhania antarctica]|uniref:hypothetical protein n=1 Tax=Chachezhania antarctica TaxID=2340860 RepID=UPI001F08BE8F|nr:hypothetical protein [Chachezhania antarctica]|tara:strand:- start:180 stop:335 length:156 start_codon:yes stop_codon:yes gene_type:complete